jgi:glutamate-1-semialdehyde 2,1-aminomutase
VDGNRGEIAAVVMEPIRAQQPEPGFLENVRDIAARIGAALVFDEVSVGFRLTTGGAHLTFGVAPDIAVFAKAISNGYSRGAIIGRASVMESAHCSFISSTYWTERIGPAAALATIRKHVRERVAGHLVAIGTVMQNGWAAAAGRAGFPIVVGGIPPLAHFAIQLLNTQAVRTLFTQRMLDPASSQRTLSALCTHTSSGHADAYLSAAEEVFRDLRAAVERNQVKSLLRGPVAHAGFHPTDMKAASEICRSLLEELREFDTALLANTIGYMDSALQHEWYMGRSI